MCDDFMAEMGAEVFVQALLIKSGGAACSKMSGRMEN